MAKPLWIWIKIWLASCANKRKWSYSWILRRLVRRRGRRWLCGMLGEGENRQKLTGSQQTRWEISSSSSQFHELAPPDSASQGVHDHVEAISSSTGDLDTPCFVMAQVAQWKLSYLGLFVDCPGSGLLSGSSCYRKLLWLHRSEAPGKHFLFNPKFILSLTYVFSFFRQQSQGDPNSRLGGVNKTIPIFIGYLYEYFRILNWIFL